MSRLARIFSLALFLPACAHTANSLGDLAAPQIGCTENQVSVLDVVRRDDGHTFRAYCQGQSHECTEQNDHVECQRENRVLATDSERARVSTTDRTVQISGEGAATVLQQGIDAGRSRLTVYAYPRAQDDHMSIVLDSRNRASSREGCPFVLVTDADAESLENVSYERTQFGERIAVRGSMRALRRLAVASRALMRVCDEELTIEQVDRQAVATFVQRYDAEAAAAQPTPRP